MARWLVVESAAFILDLQKIGPPGYSWADSILGVRWYLERGALTVGHATQDSTLRILMFDTPGDLPDLKVFYAIEGGRVTLLRARAAEPPAF